MIHPQKTDCADPAWGLRSLFVFRYERSHLLQFSDCSNDEDDEQKQKANRDIIHGLRSVEAVVGFQHADDETNVKYQEESADNDTFYEAAFPFVHVVHLS